MSQNSGQALRPCARRVPNEGFVAFLSPSGKIIR
jgi:hypothetical protein